MVTAASTGARVTADLLTRLIEAGTPAALVAEVAMLAARADAAGDALEGRRAADRNRQTRRRHATSRDVTIDNVTTRDVTGEPSPIPSPSFSPDPSNNPTPAPTRDTHPASTRGPVEAEAAVASKPRWPKDMPPPPGVSEDQWAGFIEHRIAKRERLTLRAYQLLSGKLAKHADDEWPPGRIVDQIVERRWTSFEPEWLPRKNETRHADHRTPRKSAGHQPDGFTSALRRATAKLEADELGRGQGHHGMG